MNARLKKLLWGNLSIKRILKSIVFIIISIYLFLFCFAYFYGERMIFPVPKSSYSITPTSDIKQMTLKSGGKINYYTINVPNSEFHIIYNHGNAVDLGEIQSFLRRISKNLHCSVTGYDYPGYGNTAGIPSEKNVSERIMRIYKQLKNKGVSDNQIIIWGRSIGSGPATFIAYKKPVAGLILISPFTSAFRVVTRIKLLPFDVFSNLDIISKINCPLLVIHGQIDKVIPVHHGKAIYAKAKNPKSILYVDKAGHNNVEDIGGQAYWTAISNFIKTLKANKALQ